jgi:hypothetical protein
MYADDTQLYLTFQPNVHTNETMALEQVRNCVADISQWMTFNKLKLNPDKTEFLVISTKHQRSKVHTTEVQLVNSLITANPSARNLGVIFDQFMDMDAQVTSICKAAYYHLRNINSIRTVLTHQTTETLIHAFITSRLDNGNCLLYGITAKSLNKLQQVQNSAARVLMKIKKRDHITPVLKHLHWLPVRQRIDFKLILLTWKCMHDEAPEYMKDLIMPHHPHRALRSTDQHLLNIPRSNLKSCGDRVFSIAAPKLWNTLPLDIKTISSREKFKERLKTHMYRSAFEN